MKFHKTSYQSKQRKCYRLMILVRWSKLRWAILVLLSAIFLLQFYQIRSVTYPIFFRILRNKYFSNYGSSTDTENKTTTSIPEVVIQMNDRAPSYQLAVRPDDNPYVNPERAQAKLLEDIHLYDTCQRDPSTIVVHVGPFLGDFGLYAAACGCTVYIYEAEPQIITLIHSSIKHNDFPSSRVHVFHNVVSDLPPNTTVQYPPGDGSPSALDNPVSVQTVRLDDVAWPSSSIFILKVDFEGFEMNVFRSANNLFAQKRIRHLIFKYHPWLIDRGSQKTLLSYVKNDLKAKFIYNLYRTDSVIYGPLYPNELKTFYAQHVNADLPTDIYAAFDTRATRLLIKAQRYNTNKHIT